VGASDCIAKPPCSIAENMAAEGNQKVLFTIPGKQLGSGAVHYTWQGDGNYLAMVGTNRQTQLVDRYGQVVDDISLAAGGQVLACDWDADGDTLALLQANNSAVIVWNASTKMSTALETNTKDLCWLRWSRNGPELAVGSTKGNLVIHNPRTTRMVSLLGKHSKRISCGTWGKMNQLVLGSDDKTVSISNNQGEPIGSPFSIKGEPSDIQTQPKPGKGRSSFFISVVPARAVA